MVIQKGRANKIHSHKRNGELYCRPQHWDKYICSNQPTALFCGTPEQCAKYSEFNNSCFRLT